jgi:hypothetical protein
MIPFRVVRLAAGVALALSVLAAPAWGHPGHDSTGAPVSGNTLGQHTPPAMALIAGALAFLAAIPRRRRALALGLSLLLATVSLEGMLHAALHLHNVAHSQSLPMGASPTQQAATRPDAEDPSTTPVIRLIDVTEPYDAPAPDVALASSRGRAPPLSPA